MVDDDEDTKSVRSPDATAGEDDAVAIVYDEEKEKGATVDVVNGEEDGRGGEPDLVVTPLTK